MKTSMKADKKAPVKKAKVVVKQKKAKTNTKVTEIETKMNKLESAYISAVDGQIKFSKIKEIFREIHKEIKNSVKKVKLEK
jgi:hypothetical protein